MTKNNTKRFGSVVIVISLLLIFVTSGCVKTPEGDTVVSKTNNLEKAIQITAAEDTGSAQALESKWKFDTEYDSGIKLMVDAPIFNNTYNNAPVISIKEKEFQNADDMERIVHAFFPNYKIHGTIGRLTKEQLEWNILLCKKALSEESNPDSIKTLDAQLKEFEKEYQTAPDDNILPDTDYQIKKIDADGSEQLNVIGINDNNRIDISFANWKYRKGSVFYMETISQDFEIEEEKTIALLVPPDALKEDHKFQKEKITIDQMLIDAGIDYMNLCTVSKYADGYDYYYTRTKNNFFETYVDNFFSEAQTEEDIYQDLWRSEFIKIRTINGMIYKVKWENPSELVQVDNENVQILSFEDAQEIFEKQLGYMLSPDIKSEKGKEYELFFGSGTEIHINRIELGLTKILLQNTQDSYKLIPTWSFMGYDIRGNTSGEIVNESVDASGEIVYSTEASQTTDDIEKGAEICFVTINALDGSIVNLTEMN